MDPITLGIAAVGLGTSLFGMFSSHKDQGKLSQLQQADQTLQQQQFGLQQQVNDQRQTAMEMSARRQNTETFRQAQKLQAQSAFTSNSQGAGFGSGAAAGRASGKSQGLYSSEGIQQNLGIGENIFSLDRSISQNNAQDSALKSQMSLIKGDISNDQQWTSLGNSIMGSSKTLGQVGNYIGGSVTGGMNSLNWLSQGPTGFLSNR